MKTIVEPKRVIDQLWGKQPVSNTAVYRLMHYVLRVDHDDKVLLHNVISGQLVELEEEEISALEKLPILFTPVISQLVTEHYLVPEDYQEDEQVINLRRILLDLADVQRRPGIMKYTILPTTACNARCYYCYEKGITVETMTEQTAKKVVSYVTEQCRGQKVRIRWFGGEPTLAVERIDQISEGLRRNGTDFSSTMISNGYLFDRELVKKASDVWQMESIKISIDGVRENYNSIKAYVHTDDDPYERVLRNIRLFLENGIRVNVYMNFDKNNYQDFEVVLNEFMDCFHNNPLLRIRSHQLMYDYPNAAEHTVQINETWYQDKINELNNMSRERGFLNREYGLPSLTYTRCEASSGSSVTVLPDGSLVSCPEQLSKDQIIGNLDTGITNECLIRSWQKVSHSQRCRCCILFPDCMKTANCMSADRCFIKSERMDQYRYNIQQIASKLAH